MALFLEQANIVEFFPAVALDGGANTGDWISLANYKHVAIVFQSGVGTAGDDPTITIQQATSAAGGGAKALNFTTIFRKQAAVSLAAVGAWTRTTQAAANTYTNATSAEEDSLWVVEFDADQLDVDLGFKFIQCSVADVGNNAQPGACLAILTEPRYPAAPESQISALA